MINMNKMKIDIWSDIACPYCYIGKRKLEIALDQFPEKDKIELVWHSYELEPELPKKAKHDSIYKYYEDKFGLPEDQARKNLHNVAELAKEVGLEYNFDKLVVANTHDALRLVKLAAESNKADLAEEVLFKAYFTEGKDISDKITLIQLGESIGLSEISILEMLNSNKYSEDIKKDIIYSEKELGLQYIPFYVFNNKQKVEGSIPVEDYLSILIEAYNQWEHNGTSSAFGEFDEIISGQSCSIDGVCS